ncbi:hypothetical protein BpHYR1_035639 [Brachionus plicatilis]|uniref:Ig-like domain-containing protein n=1 Tax=Brachionus plicatilis TaxID=10195 RepID=A0A3M7RQF5_BRAPC|nr:hypothetical protein BpHYR1_035639 [Brachionus plicatilis]
MTVMKFVFICTLLFCSCFIDCKLVWKKRPEPAQIVNEYDNIELDCEFQEDNPSLVNQTQYFVIWYRDGSSQNVLSLNDKLANLDSTNYQIVGKYNLLIKNASKANSGLYTCQLFQSTDLISSVNLTVLDVILFERDNLQVLRKIPSD